MLQKLEGDVSQYEQRVLTVFESQQATAIAWRRSSVSERLARIGKLREALVSRRARLFKAFEKDLGKSETEAMISELTPLLSEIQGARRHLKKWMRAKSVAPTMTTLGTFASIRPEPRGRALIISPWNYPLSLTFGPLVSALAAGCPAIIKPSEITPNVSAAMKEIVEAAFPSAEVALFEGEADLSNYLLSLPFDHIFFTGSPNIGKIVMAAAAKHLTSVTLELGGKSPVIINKDADVARSAETIAWGKLLNCGQTCIAPDYAYVHEDVWDEFVAAFKKTVKSFYGQNTSAAPSSSYSRIVSQRHAGRLDALLKDAQEKGAHVLEGGEADAGTRFVAPTLVNVTDVACRLREEEIFGPILPLMKFRDVEDAIQAINAQPKPLALYIFARAPEFCDEIVQRTSSGSVGINSCLVQFSHENLPFGGVSNSGLGRGHGYFGFEAFSHFKPVLKTKIFSARMMFPPYTATKKRMAALLMKLAGG